jgi:hypothetical protein
MQQKIHFAAPHMFCSFPESETAKEPSQDFSIANMGHCTADSGLCAKDLRLGHHELWTCSAAG